MVAPTDAEVGKPFAAGAKSVTLRAPNGSRLAIGSGCGKTLLLCTQVQRADQ
jgi:hypothetical protein